MSRLTSSLVLGLLAVPGGCISTPVGTYAVLTNRNVSTTDLRIPPRAEGRRVVGEDIQEMAVVGPYRVSRSFEGALDDALVRGGGDVILDARVEHVVRLIPFVYAAEGWRIEGTVVDTRRP